MCHPAGAAGGCWDWRVAIAELRRDALFPARPGVRHTVVVLPPPPRSKAESSELAGLVLSSASDTESYGIPIYDTNPVKGSGHLHPPLELFSFSGDEARAGRLRHQGTPIRAFSVAVTSRRVTACTELVHAIDWEVQGGDVFGSAYVEKERFAVRHPRQSLQLPLAARVATGGHEPGAVGFLFYSLEGTADVSVAAEGYRVKEGQMLVFRPANAFAVEAHVHVHGVPRCTGVLVRLFSTSTSTL